MADKYDKYIIYMILSCFDWMRKAKPVLNFGLFLTCKQHLISNHRHLIRFHI